MSLDKPWFDGLAPKGARIIGALGWAWGLILILSALPAFLRRFDDNKPYPVGELGREVGALLRVEQDLRGPLLDRVEDRSVCDSMWFDRDDGVLIRGIGPRNGSTAQVWLALTVGGQVVVGRATVDLWNGVGMGTGSLESSTSFTVAHDLRLVERLAPPRPGPPGWRTIRPGECVLGKAEIPDARGTIGRFLIDLPAHRSVRVWAFLHSLGADEEDPLTVELALNGGNVPKVRVAGLRDERYQTPGDGRYEILIRTRDGGEVGREVVEAHRHFTVQVDWGEPIAVSPCFPPSEWIRCCAEVRP